MLRYYLCHSCGEFSDYRKDQNILTDCPTCGMPVIQQYGLAFVLKGDGYYSTDNKETQNVNAGN